MTTHMCLEHAVVHISSSNAAPFAHGGKEKMKTKQLFLTPRGTWASELPLHTAAEAPVTE